MTLPVESPYHAARLGIQDGAQKGPVLPLRHDSALVLLQMGGPSMLRDLPDFYERLFNDPDLIQLPEIARRIRPFLARLLARSRARAMRSRYELIGGGSPLLRHTAGLAFVLERELAARGAAAGVKVALRYTEPLAGQVVADLRSEGVRDVVLLPLYPHWSRATSGSSVSDFQRAARSGGLDAQVRLVRSWGTAPAYLDLLAHYVRRAYFDLRRDWDGPVHVLMSAHGLPRSYVRHGDPYRDEVEATARGLAAQLPDVAGWRLSYQSRMGPMRWLEPSTDEALRRLADEGARAILAVPLGFVSDHIETLYDLDVLYQGRATALGLEHYRRVAAFNSDPAFARVLIQILAESTLEDLAI